MYFSFDGNTSSNYSSSIHLFHLFFCLIFLSIFFCFIFLHFLSFCVTFYYFLFFLQENSHLSKVKVYIITFKLLTKAYLLENGKHLNCNCQNNFSQIKRAFSNLFYEFKSARCKSNINSYEKRLTRTQRHSQ